MHPATDALAFTACRSADPEECYRLGVNAFVVKPVRFEEFVKAVKQVGAFWALINVPPPGTVSR